MSLRDILLSLVLAAHSTQPNAGDPTQLARLRGVVDDMVAVGKTNAIFSGDAGPEATTVALYAVARHESGFWSKVQDCSVCFPGSAWCDHGRSITLYQIMRGSGWGAYTREELCSDNRKASERAAIVLGRSSSRSTTVSMFNAYAGCSTFRTCRAARELEAGFRATLAKAGVSVVWKGMQNEAVWVSR